MSFRNLLIFLIICTTTLCISCEKTKVETDSSLKAQIESLVEDHNIPGAIGIVVNSTSVVDIYSEGLRRSGTSRHVTNDDYFFVGSITKSMTSTMIAKLVQDEALSWESRPSEIMPDLSDIMHQDYKEITLLDLLRHRAGVPSDDMLSDIPSFDGNLMEQRLAGTQWVMQKSPEVARGTFNYSNTGYLIAAAMAEYKTGKDWRRLMDSLLFEPLDINAFYGWPTEYDANQPIGHTFNGQVYEPAGNGLVPLQGLRLVEPAGIASMTIIDLSKFVQLHLNALQNNPSVLSSEVFEVLHTSIDGYGCGLQVLDGELGTLYLHDGSDDFNYAVMAFMPQQDIAVAIMVNAYGDQVEENVLEALDNVLLGFVN